MRVSNPRLLEIFNNIIVLGLIGLVPISPRTRGRWPHENGRLFIQIVRKRQSYFGEAVMLETIAIVLVVLWLLGLVSAYTLGGFIHVLLVIAVVIILLRVIQGRRPV
jgi:hypothetical protein